MKTIGLIGGMAWQSAADFYRIINEEVNKRLGGQHSCQCVLYSVDLDPILIHRENDNWQELADIMVDAIHRVEAAGADFSVIVSNTMHRTYDDVIKRVARPVLHIGDMTAQEILRRGYQKVGLLGTRFTLEQDFYKGRLRDKFGIEVIVPGEEDIQIIHNVIYNELDYSILNPASRQEYVRVIEELQARGAEAVVLGCTEIAELVKQSDTVVPLIDTNLIHALAAVDLALT